MEPLGAVLGRAYALAGPGAVGDRELLARFTGGDPAAFAALVRRHGPLVYGVCRRHLGDTPDADDAFQATFLLLVRKAGSVRDPAALGPWLYGVARRTALKARSLAARRKERPLTDVPAATGDPDLGPTLDAAVAALPAGYRAAVVLCYFEGLSHAAAGGRLGCPAATVATRLMRARELLRRWLAKRGYGPAAFVPPGPVPATLLARAAALTPGATVPSSVAMLAEGVGRTMLLQSWSKALACVALLGLAGFGTWALGPASADPPKADKPAVGGVVAVPLASLRRPAQATYTVDAGDVLDIYLDGIFDRRDRTVHGPETGPVGWPVTVQGDGTIQLPLMDTLRVRGSTLAEIRKNLIAAYAQAGMIVPEKTRAFVALAKPRTHAITVVRLAGAATNTVELPTSESDVFTALVKSGNFEALHVGQTVVVHRRHARGPGDDQRTTIRLTHKAGEPLPFKPEDVVLESGDVVVIERP